jgi:inosine/xanthosine triphosphate pyrophosphatase family protein
MGWNDDAILKWAVDLLNYADPDQVGQHIVLADDLMARRADRASLEQAADRLAALRDDQTITNAEIKGLLNRASGKTWGGEYDRVFEPREFVAELERAVRDYLRRRPDLR